MDVVLQEWALTLDAVGVVRERRVFSYTQIELRTAMPGGGQQTSGWDCAGNSGI